MIFEGRAVTYDELDRRSSRLAAFLFSRGIGRGSLAGIYIALGDKEQGLALLEKAYENRDFYLCELKVDPDWDPVRSDPRFQRLLRQLNFE